MRLTKSIIQKTARDYNKIAAHFASTRYDLWPDLEQFKPIIKDGQRVLDWGCGSGRLLLLLQGKKIEYHGVDISHKLLDIFRAKRAALIKEFSSAQLYCNARIEPKFSDNYFDLAFMIASFFHLPTPALRRKLLRKTYRALKPGGKLIMTVWNLRSDWARTKRKKDWRQIGPHDFLIPWKDQAGQTQAMRYYHHFSKLELCKLLREAGFVVERLAFFLRNVWSDSKGGRNLIAVARKAD